MGSDTFTVRIEKIEHDSVVLDLLPAPSGGFEDCYTSRSFALLIMHDALIDAHDKRDVLDDDRLRAKHERAPLIKALKRHGKDWRYSPEWMEAHVGRFVVRTEVLARSNQLGERQLRRREAEITAKMGGTLYTDREREWQPLRWKQLFHYLLRVVVTDPKWIAHLEEGLEFGTGAYEVWKEPEAAPAPRAARSSPATSRKTRRG